MKESITTKWGFSTVHKLPKFISNGKTVTLGVERIVVTGSGGSEYRSFPNIDQTFRDLVYRMGAGHNNGNDGKIMHRRSTDSGLTWGSESILVQSDGTYNCTNPTIIKTSTGRIIVTFDKHNTSDGVRHPWLVYTDNDFVSVSAHIQITADYPAPGYVSSCGNIYEQDGILYMPLYVDVTGSTPNDSFAVAYKSTDDGLTWAFAFTIAPVQHEPIFAMRPDGLMMVGLRDQNTTSDGNLAYSPNFGPTAKWSNFYHMNRSKSKNMIAFSPSGTMICVWRNSDDNNYSYWNYSNDGGRVWSTPERVDSRDSTFEYAGGGWSTVNNCFVFTICTEIGTPFDSPTIMVTRTFLES